MGSRNAFTYVASSSGYLKPASLYDGYSYTKSSFYTNNGNTDNTALTRNQTNSTFNRGGGDGLTTEGRTYSVSSYTSNPDQTNNRLNVGATTYSDFSSTSGSGNVVGNSTQFGTEQNYTDSDSDSGTGTGTILGFGRVTYESSWGSTKIFVNLRNVSDSQSSSGYTLSRSNEYSAYKTINNTPVTESKATSYTSTGYYGFTYRTLDEENYTDTWFTNSSLTTYITSFYIKQVDSQVYGSTLSIYKTETATTSDSDLNVTITSSVYTTTTRSDVVVNNGFSSWAYSSLIQNLDSTDDTEDSDETKTQGEVDVTGTTDSTTYSNQIAQGIKTIYTTGQSTRYVLPRVSTTYSKILGIFFGETITHKYTTTDFSDYTEQSNFGTVTSTAITQLWDNAAYDFLIDKTLSAVGGVYGFLSDLKESIADSYTTSYALTDAESSYFSEGQIYSPRGKEFNFVRGTETSPDKMTLTRTLNLYDTSDTSQVDYTGLNQDTGTYTYYKIGTQTGSNYYNHGYLDVTYTTYDIATSSRSVFWKKTDQSSKSVTLSTTTTYEVDSAPTDSRSFLSGDYTTVMTTYFGSEIMDTHPRTVISYTSSSYPISVLVGVGGLNMTWKSVDNSPAKGAFNSYQIKDMNVSVASYESMSFPYDEMPFCSVTSTNRASRKKASPPDVDYKEFFLSTTADSDDVTKYYKNTRTAESWFIPQAGYSLLNGMIYVPKDERFEIIDQGRNTMSFSNNNQNTQIIRATFVNVSSGLTRSTTSEFVRFFTVGAGLISRSQPKSYSQTGVYSFEPTILGGQNDYEDNGTACLFKDCTFTLFDSSGGSSVYENKESENIFTTSTVPTGMISISAPDQLCRVTADYKNNIIVTRRGEEEYEEEYYWY